MRALVAVVACLLAVAGAMVVPASPAYAAVCPSPDAGVTVVVDFSRLGGGTAVRCAPGDPATGLAALTAAGFSYEFVPGQPGFVCRIDGSPDPCNGAPVDAYWSYWHASAGGSWQYSSLGAGGRDPAPGTVEGWAFGAGERPGMSPPSPPPPPKPPEQDPPKPPPARPDPGGSRPDPGQEPGRDPGRNPGRDPGVGDDSPGSDVDRPDRDRDVDQDGDQTGAPMPPTPAASGSPPPEAAAPTPAAASGSADGGSGPVGVILAAVLVAALGLGGWWVARRRIRLG